MSKIYQSPFPSVNLVTSHLWHFLYSPEFPAPWKTLDPNRDAFIDGITGDSIKFGQMRSLTSRIAYAFRNRLGLQPGDTVLVLSKNHIFIPVIIHSTVAATLTYTACNFDYTVDEIAYQLSDSNAKVIIAHKDFRDKAIKAGAKAGIPDNKVYCIQDETGINSIWDYVDENVLIPPQFNLEQAKDTVALMCYSSGTSGKPKGVESSHYNLTSVTLQVSSVVPDFTKEIHVCFLPCFHMLAAFLFPFRAFNSGATTVILPGFEMDLLLGTIEKYRATSVNAVPPVILNMLKHMDPKKYDLRSLKAIKSGAAPLGVDVIDQFEEKFKIPIQSGYGMTESTCTITAGAEGGGGKKNSNGHLIANMEAKFLNGELLVRGPNIMKGYHNNPQATKEMFIGDWMRTGDIGYFDPDDHSLFITDRVKELIKYKGFQVAPAELEDLLLKHPDISDTAVVAYPQDSLEELPRAYVVLKESSKGKVKEHDIVEWAAKHTSNYKRLRGGVVFKDVIPKSSSGKILRRQLRDEVAKEIELQKKAKL